MELTRLGAAWMPQLLPVTPDLVTEALHQAWLTTEDVTMLLTLPPVQLAESTAYRRLMLVRLQTEGAPVQ